MRHTSQLQRVRKILARSPKFTDLRRIVRIADKKSISLSASSTASSHKHQTLSIQITNHPAQIVLHNCADRNLDDFMIGILAVAILVAAFLPVVRFQNRKNMTKVVHIISGLVKSIVLFLLDC